MTKKRLWGILLILPLLIILLSPQESYTAPKLPTLNTSELDKGIVSVDYDLGNKTKYIIRINKGMKNYDYEVVPNGKYPLQSGNGVYKIMLGELVTGKTYKPVASEKIKLDLTDHNIVFLQSTRMIDWNAKTKVVVKANELVKNAKSDEEKVALIYKYIVNTVTYDYEKAKIVETGYIPNLDVTYDKKTGICYDYATMMAAMLRSEGIPTKMVMGFHKDDLKTYHAWNEVYVGGKWYTIDTTYDAIKFQAGYTTPMYQNEIDYIAAYKEY